MESLTPLEARIASLETALRRSRVVTTGLVIALVSLVLVPTMNLDTNRAEAAASPAQEDVTARRVVLTDADNSPSLVLMAGPNASLVLMDPAGQEVLRIGGPPARRIGH